MKVAIIYNKDLSAVINIFGLKNREVYNPKTVHLVAEALEKGGHNVQIIDGNMHVIERLQEFMPMVIEGERMGMVFNMAYGIQGESRYTHLPALLEMLGVPYVGSGPAGHALALDKVTTKIFLQKYGLPTPQYWVFSTGDEDMSEVEFPAIVKPKMEAVSFGLKIANNERDLKEGVEHIIDEFKQQALVEQFIRGREFCVGLLGNGDPEAFPVLEVDLGKDPNAIQTEFDKRKSPRNKICPAKISKEIADSMLKLSKDAFRYLGLKDFARVDIRMDTHNNIYLLEVNSMASLGLTGTYVYAARIAGYDHDRLVNKMLEVAAVRYFAKDLGMQEERTRAKKAKLPLSARMRGFLRTHQDRTEELLSKMVSINSYVRNVEGVNALGRMIRRNLNPLVFKCQIIPQVEVGNIFLLSNTVKDDYDVLLISHLDNSTPFTKHINYRATPHKLYGTGIWSNKGGLAIMTAALQVLRFVRLLQKLKIGILLTPDNILQGRISKDYIAEVSRKAQHVIGLSGASSTGAVVTSRSGAAVYECQMNLENADHAEDIAAANACFNVLLTSLVKLSSKTGSVLVTLRDVSIKSSIGSLYTHGEAALSVRFNDTKQGNTINKKIRELVRKTMCGKTRFQISGSMRRPPMTRTKHTEMLYNLVKQICSELDISVLEEHRWTSSDICFVDDNRHKIDGMGPVGDVTHNEEEYILRHSLTDRALVLAQMLDRLKKETH